MSNDPFDDKTVKDLTVDYIVDTHVGPSVDIHERNEVKYNVEDNYNSIVKDLTPDDLRNIVKSITNGRIGTMGRWAIIQGFDPEVFLKWLNNQEMSSDSENMVKNSLINGILQNRETFSVSGLQAIKEVIQDKVVLIDGDNLARKSTPVFIFNLHSDSLVFYRNDTIPNFVHALRQLFNTNSKVVHTYDIKKDAADALVISKAASIYKGGREVFLVSNDHIMDEAVNLGKDAGYNVSKIDSRGKEKFFYSADYADDEDDNLGSQSNWFVTLIKSGVHVDVRPEYNVIHNYLIRGDDIENLILTLPPDEGYDLYQQYMVYTCAKYLTTKSWREIFKDINRYLYENSQPNGEFYMNPLIYPAPLYIRSVSQQAVEEMNRLQIPQHIKVLTGAQNFLTLMTSCKTIQYALNVVDYTYFNDRVSTINIFSM